MAPYWSSIDVLLIPSRHEGLPLAALEAMAHGVPVIAFAVGGLPNLINDHHNGWLVEAGNKDALTNCLKKWNRLSPTEQQNTSENARQTIIERYSPSAVLPQILSIYRQCSESFLYTHLDSASSCAEQS